MKPDINWADPKVKLVLEFYENQMRIALEVPQRVESAVFPIYHTIKSPTKPEQIGSGVLVCIGKEYFIFSASHVFDSIGKNCLLIALTRGKPLFSILGERFSTKKGDSGSHIDDPIDASVFHIQQPLPKEIANIALTTDDLDIGNNKRCHSAFLASGFRSKKSRTIGDQANAKRESYPTTEYKQEEYALLDINREIHIALAYEDMILVNHNWQKSPSPKGFSGGAIIKVQGINMTAPFLNEPNPKQMLSAITIEQRREKHGKPGVLIGTRIEVHLMLIDHFLPGLRVIK